MSPTRQRELDRTGTDQGSICPARSKSSIEWESMIYLTRATLFRMHLRRRWDWCVSGLLANFFSSQTRLLGEILILVKPSKVGSLRTLTVHDGIYRSATKNVPIPNDASSENSQRHLSNVDLFGTDNVLTVEISKNGK